VRAAATPRAAASPGRSNSERKTGSSNTALAVIADEVVARLAPRVEEWLRDLLADREPPAPAELPQLVDAATLAHLLGVSRSWVYDHADTLAAVRIGDGERPRLRFDVELARSAMRRAR
jgi:hypothetical protein